MAASGKLSDRPGVPISEAVAEILEAPEIEIEERQCVVCKTRHKDGTPPETTLCMDCWTFNEEPDPPKYLGTLGVRHG